MTTVPEALASLERALNGLLAALESGRSDAVLAAEGPLALAVRQLLDAASPTDVDRAHVRSALRAVRLSLARAQHLGAASAHYIQVVVPHASYGAHGQLVSETRPAVASKG
jgi:hypothetical protein